MWAISPATCSQFAWFTPLFDEEENDGAWNDSRRSRRGPVEAPGAGGRADGGALRARRRARRRSPERLPVQRGGAGGSAAPVQGSGAKHRRRGDRSAPAHRAPAADGAARAAEGNRRDEPLSGGGLQEGDRRGG